ncbi:MAG: hypothetical protein JWQ09_761 [Segetibacter sp.]|nr:hypothetical protein [Segetibacter sp.]
MALGCTHQINSGVSVFPKDFKVQIPFILSGRGIIINTYWGAEKTHHVLCLDNYSPSWIKGRLIKYDKSFGVSKGNTFSTSTADGTQIQGDVGICDSLTFENVTFIKAPFYVMPHNTEDNKDDDGVFGSELMSKGIWKIDFKRNELTFTSDIDSLQGLRQTETFPSIFNDQSIKINVEFGNNIVKTMALDLGFNGDLMMPLKEFDKLSTRNRAITAPARFSTPGSNKNVTSLMIFDTVTINHDWFFAIITSNETIKERLIGLQFFRRFDFVIFDFINKRIYVPKKVW